MTAGSVQFGMSSIPNGGFLPLTLYVLSIIIHNSEHDYPGASEKGKTATDNESYKRVIPGIGEEATLFPIGSTSKGD